MKLGSVCVLFPNRVQELMCYYIIRHSQLCGLHNSECGKRVLHRALSQITRRNIDILISNSSEKLSEELCDDVYWVNIFSFVDKPLINYSSFKTVFDYDRFIRSHMSKAYWWFIDKNIDKALTNRYIPDTIEICSSELMNIYNCIRTQCDIDGLSSLLFFRYRYELEPFLLIHSMFYNLPSACTIKFHISSGARKCSFGRKCRKGNAFVTTHSQLGNSDFKVEYCMCKYHLRKLKTPDVEINFKRLDNSSIFSHV